MRWARTALWTAAAAEWLREPGRGAGRSPPTSPSIRPRCTAARTTSCGSTACCRGTSLEHQVRQGSRRQLDEQRDCAGRRAVQQLRPGRRVVGNADAGAQLAHGQRDQHRLRAEQLCVRGQDDFAYSDYYRSVAGIDPPLKPFGAIPIRRSSRSRRSTNGRICRTGVHRRQPGQSRCLQLATAQGRALPTANWNKRWSGQDDLSITRGRHNLKFGFYTEFTLKTEPGSSNYMGNFDFGSSATNPLDTGYPLRERAPGRLSELHGAVDQIGITMRIDF